MSDLSPEIEFKRELPSMLDEPLEAYGYLLFSIHSRPRGTVAAYRNEKRLLVIDCEGGAIYVHLFLPEPNNEWIQVSIAGLFLAQGNRELLEAEGGRASIAAFERNLESICLPYLLQEGHDPRADFCFPVDDIRETLRFQRLDDFY